jgi:hypothetical protein
MADDEMEEMQARLDEAQEHLQEARAELEEERAKKALLDFAKDQLLGVAQAATSSMNIPKEAAYSNIHRKFLAPGQEFTEEQKETVCDILKVNPGHEFNELVEGFKRQNPRFRGPDAGGRRSQVKGYQGTLRDAMQANTVAFDKATAKCVHNSIAANMDLVQTALKRRKPGVTKKTTKRMTHGYLLEDDSPNKKQRTRAFNGKRNAERQNDTPPHARRRR